MPTRAVGTFEVKLLPQVAEADAPKLDQALGRMAIDKRFRGDLEAVGKGQMLSAATTVASPGSDDTSSGATRSPPATTTMLGGRSRSTTFPPLALPRSGSRVGDGVGHPLSPVRPELPAPGPVRRIPTVPDR